MATVLQTRLAEAQAALHDILTGASVRSVTDSNGEKVEYRAVDIARLRAYIQELQAQVDAEAGTTVNNGPMVLWL